MMNNVPVQKAHGCLEYREEEEQLDTGQVCELWEYLWAREASHPAPVRLHLRKPQV